MHKVLFQTTLYVNTRPANVFMHFEMKIFFGMKILKLVFIIAKYPKPNEVAKLNHASNEVT